MSRMLGLFPAYDSEADGFMFFAEQKCTGSVNISALAQQALHDGAAAQSLHPPLLKVMVGQVVGGEMKHGFAV